MLHHETFIDIKGTIVDKPIRVIREYAWNMIGLHAKIKSYRILSEANAYVTFSERKIGEMVPFNWHTFR